MNKDEGKEWEGRTQQFMRSYEWGRILIITGYKQQKRLLREILAELPEADVSRGLVSARTIDDSPSHQAEVVICDLVRTDKPGFMVEDERLEIMKTNHICNGSLIRKGRKNKLVFIEREGKGRATVHLHEYPQYKELWRAIKDHFDILKLEDTMRELMSSLDKTQLEKLWKLRELTSLDEDQIQELQRIHESMQTNADTLIRHFVQHILRLGRHAQRGINSPH
ncbi:AAA domain-containing protein [Trichoderma breve]|uniref:AAA domain-containing protein n=1 Tax=Trichoderma breve TaxID=2034170 RepID=A0A9W9JQJ3_9HYPO|nr:AAA domain-containing protein [Trichoderma breve]KAJ4864148.1 AAA domain-containing protein [Trichoderma breve]